ncbi:undecaprenyl/decaprenyl-phosphate alpha-N-acetylglucosaminyl 1-phosphate transferase [Bdellovibrio sp. ZAP7]|uniref:glycosyltransferase family 4 protein n=1 Tax=Bdellovibrio sp. ZAP7 TaxID=2231053 RepID=UPI001158F5C2|nr:MraY family glycosyltransferase [Bdellovibrio sp. ZAP7]QDK45353.1 undecaprenyl/decaprenyl-phosphate alpha-N-acetylglucosaminyl 1-phosphate transferase [Bdellovibrio sp. ZAP7]
MFLSCIGPFILSLIIAVVSIPVIIRVADLKHLMDEPDQDRKFHSIKTPTLGGVAIFAGLSISFSFFTDFIHADEIRFMTPSIILLFLAGIKDDILVLSPIKKLLIQCASSLLVTVFGNLYLTNLWGMFGINEIPPILGMFLSFITFVALINAFNLIDGINGLAGGLGFIASIFFGAWFSATNFQSLSILAFSLAGALLGFLYFNFGKAKIFMGDTGSMLIGFIISILAIKFIECNRIPGFETSVFYVKAAPGVAIAAVFIPLFDMTRVILIRIVKRKSPFSADRIHIHHKLVDEKLSHTKAALVLYIISVSIIGLAVYLKNLRSLELVGVLAGLGVIMSVAIRYCHLTRKERFTFRPEKKMI